MRHSNRCEMAAPGPPLEIWVLLGMLVGLNRRVLIRIIAEEESWVWRERGSSWSETQGRGFRFVSRSAFATGRTLWRARLKTVQYKGGVKWIGKI